MFASLRKKRASQQQAASDSTAAGGSNAAPTASTSPSKKHYPEDQPVIDMLRSKSYSRHPQSKDGDELSMDQRASGGMAEVAEEEEDPDDDDDDLFKFMPPPDEPHHPSSHLSSTASDREFRPLTSADRPSTGTASALLPAHQLAKNASKTQTATTAPTMASDDIVPIPFLPDLRSRALNTPTSMPQTVKSDSPDQSPISHTPHHSPRHYRPAPIDNLTEAQRLARDYQGKQSQPERKRSDSPDAQYVANVLSADGGTPTSATTTTTQKRRQPYRYPGSPVYNTSGNPMDVHKRLDTPVIELADADTSTNRERGASTGSTSYPPVYGLHPNDRDSPLDATNTANAYYSKHYVDVSNTRRLSSQYQPTSPRTLRPRISRTYSSTIDDENLKPVTLGEWSLPQSPELDQDYFHVDSSSGMESKNGIGIASRDGNMHYPTTGRFATEDGMDETAVGSTPGVGSGKDFEQFELEDEEDSPYPEVRASVSNIDDPEMPCLTFRAWFIGLLFVVLGAALNLFFSVRYPAPLITPLTLQILSYPIGKALARVLPMATHKTPAFLRILGAPAEWSLNPGPFNIKEHAIIYIMVSISIAPSYALSFTFTLDKFYGLQKGPSFDFLTVLTTTTVGFSFAGLCRRYLVWPASLIWPQNLVTCTLFNTFHAEDDDGMDGSLTRFKYFGYVSIAAAIWYLLPGFLFTALSAFSFICWAAPRSKVINQLFGVSSGLGMSMLTLDWSQIAYTVSPLVVPWWAEVNIFVGFVLLYWIITPILYYTNTWNFAYMPISAAGNFDRFGQFYDVTRVITPEVTLDEDGYIAYSMLFMSTTYATVYALSFTLASAAIVHTIIYNGKDIYLKFRNAHTEIEDVHAKLMRNYPEVPDWWYWGVFVVFTAMGIATIEVYETQLPIWAFLISLLVVAVYILPGGFIYAICSQLITVNLIAEMIPGYALPGKPIANMLFKTFAVQCLQSALYFLADLKLGHYMKIPPRITFMVQLVAVIFSAAAQVGVKRALEVLVPDLCTAKQKDLLSCPGSAVNFEASIIWGVIGPSRFFGKDSLYQPLLYFVLLGALLPIPFYFLTKKYPRSWVKYVNIPVLLNGASFIPPATGINYSSWFFVGFIFRKFRWWSKFCFITSAALEGGTILAAIIIFFAFQLPKGGLLQPEWWGNDVYKKTSDWEGVPYISKGKTTVNPSSISNQLTETVAVAPEEGFGPTEWS